MEPSIRLIRSSGTTQRFALLIACNRGSTRLGYYTGDSASLPSATDSSVPNNSLSMETRDFGQLWLRG